MRDNIVPSKPLVYMVPRVLLGLVALWGVWQDTAKAQLTDTTIVLQSTTIYGVAETAFRYGGTQYTWDSLSDPLQVAGGGSVAQYLQRQAPVFFKAYGSGGALASVTLRGTGASHTAVLWNGLNINSPTLGQSDFGQLPTALIDGLALQLGPGSAAYGTDALGGSVHLESRLPWTDPSNASVRLGVGSFGEWRGSGYAQGHTKALYWKLRASYVTAQNDFPYTDITDLDRPIVRQENAEWHQTSFQPSLGWRIAPGHRVVLHGWWQQAHRQIQPVMGRSSEDLQQDSVGRWTLAYHGGHGLHAWESQIATSTEGIVFNGSRSGSHQWQGKLRWSTRWNDAWRSEAALIGVQSWAEGENYLPGAQQQRLSLMGSVQYHPLPRWKAGIRLRQTVWNEGLAPLTPSLSLEGPWRFGTWQARAARSYRIPTLNDLFWIRSVQQPIVPEDAWSGEGTFSWIPAWGQVSITAYAMQVQNWILWVPGVPDWYPSNVRAVDNLGVEAVATAEKQWGPIALETRAQYAWNRATIQEDVVASSLGNQLPYTPMHQGSGWLQAEWQAFRLRLTGQWVGQRFTSTDNTVALPSYGTLDLAVAYQTKLGNDRLHAVGEIRNLTNEQYQVVRLRAMPGRSFHLTLQYDITFKTNKQ